MLPVLVLAALAVLPANAPLTDLPAGADPCIALTPAVVDRLRTSGALTPLVPDEIPSSTLITVGRALTNCPPTADPDPATIQGRVCPLLTAEGVDALADRFRASPALRADLGPERIALARNALDCDRPAATAAAAPTAGPDGETSPAVDRADPGAPQERGLTVISVTAAVVALIGVLLLVVATGPRRRPEGEAHASGRQQVPHPAPGAAGPGRLPDERDRDEAGDSDGPDGPTDRSVSYDELLAGLRREVTEFQRSDEASRKRSATPDDRDEH